ncbi:MAG: transcriptional regulator [Bacteroidetes bacterium]|nr:MAG: transcriptional regulator [Bacteroidota bacterium]
MNRIDRITAILIQLQSRKIVRAQEISDRFKISLRTVYRDIKSLEEAGIPILGETGVGYSIMDGYRLPPVMFTKEEAIAFLTAEKLIEKFTDHSTGSSYKSAMYKIRSILRSNEKDMLENIEDHIEVIRRYSPFHSESVDNTLQMILKSISDKKVLHIEYEAFNATEKTSRDIEPVGIFYSGGYWHTIAFCQLRKDYRDFRTDRISQLKMTEMIIHDNHPTLQSYLEKVARKENLEKVVISIDKKTAKYLQEAKYYYGFVDQSAQGDRVLMNFLTPSLDIFVRWFFMFADMAEILEPYSAQGLMKVHIEKLAKKF